MKYILFLIPLLFVFAGCSTLPDREPETVTLQTEEKDSARIEKEKATHTARSSTEEEKRMQNAPVSTEVTLLLKEARYYGNGKLDSYTVFSYMENSPLLIREEVYTPGDVLYESVVYEYEDGLRTRKHTYTADGRLDHRRSFVYRDGLLTNDALYDENGNPQTESRYEYDGSGRKRKWSVFDGSGIELGYTTYEYEDGKNVRINIYSLSDALEKYSIIEYGQGGRRLRESFFLPDGSLEKYTVYEYERDLLSCEKYYTGKKELVRTVRYGYDEKGNATEVQYLDARGDIEETKKNTYSIRTILEQKG